MNVAFASSDRQFGKKFTVVALSLLMAVILFSTYLHHFRPDVLKVPSNTDVSTWKMTPLEKTWIYDRMTEGERETIRKNGVPGTDAFHLLLYELLSLFGAWMCFVHARKHYSLWMATAFLVGSFVFTGVQETLMILSGRFWMGGGLVDPNVWGSYWFPQGILWFLETPVWVCLCWFLIAYSCVTVAGKVFPRAGLWSRAFVGGMIAMVIDLWEDPVLTSPEHMKWIWAKGDHVGILGIPHGNFIGWFFLIFVFAILWEKYLPVFEKRLGGWGGMTAFMVLLLCCNVIILTILITWGGIANQLFPLPEGLHIPPASWGW